MSAPPPPPVNSLSRFFRDLPTLPVMAPVTAPLVTLTTTASGGTTFDPAEWRKMIPGLNGAQTQARAAKREEDVAGRWTGPPLSQFLASSAPTPGRTGLTVDWSKINFRYVCICPIKTNLGKCSEKTIKYFIKLD